MEFYPIDFVLHIINIVVLFVLVRSLAYKPVRKFMLAREERIKSQLDEAAAAKAEAETLKADCASRLADVEKERQAILDESREAAAKESRSIVDAAKDEATGILDAARANADTMAERAMSDARAELTGTAVALAGKVLCFDEAARMRAMQMNTALSGEAEAVVKVADAAGADELDDIKTCLENLSGRHLTLKVEQDESLLGGFVGYVEGKVYDFSYAAQLHELQRALS